MSIVFDPTKMLRRIAPKAKIRRMVSGKMGLKRTILANIGTEEIPIKNGSLAKIARKTLTGYKERISKAIAQDHKVEGLGAELKAELLDDPKQLIQRVQNEVIYQVHQGIRKKYKGRRARWLPSSAEEPRPVHQSAYGKEYIIGEGLPVGDDGGNVEPGDDWGCQCGVEILDTDETQLDLS